MKDRYFSLINQITVFIPNEHVEATTTTPEAQPLPEGPTTGPQNTGTQNLIVASVTGGGGEHVDS